MNFPQKIKLYHPAIPPLVIHTKERKSEFWGDICIMIFISKLFTIDKLWKQPVSTNRWMDKKCDRYSIACVCTCMCMHRIEEQKDRS